MGKIGPGYWTNERRRGALRVVLAMTAGLLLRLWMIAHGQRVNGDSLIYGDIAKNLLQHGVYGFTGLSGTVRPTLLRLPGFPLFLAGCFAVCGVEHYRAVMYVQAAIDLATCGLVAGAAGQMYGRRAWWAALWLGALCPFTAEYTGAVLTETLSIFCVASAFYGMVRWQKAGLGVNRWVWVVGASLAYAVLLRPEQGLLAAAMVPTMAWMAWPGGRRKRGLLAVALTAVLVIAPLAPWAARNWLTFHVFQPLAPRQANDPGELVPFGFMRWYRTFGVDFLSTDEVYWRYDTDPINVSDLPMRAFDSPNQYRETAKLLDEYNETTTGNRRLRCSLREDRGRSHPRELLPLLRRHAVSTTAEHALPATNGAAQPAAGLVGLPRTPPRLVGSARIRRCEPGLLPARSIGSDSQGRRRSDFRNGVVLRAAMRDAGDDR